MRIDRYVTVSATDRWVEFPLDGPTLLSGDLYVGYEAPNPHDGVGFACDTSGAQQDRAWYSFTSGASFQCTLRLNSGAKANVMMRARVLLQDSDVDLELRTDDGISETGLLKGNMLAVNRLTPPNYPAKLKTVRLFFEQFSKQSSPLGNTVRVVAFTDPTGGGRPPEGKPRFDVDRPQVITALDQWFDIAVNGPVIESGDFYVGFQTPADRQERRLGYRYAGGTDLQLRGGLQIHVAAVFGKNSTKKHHHQRRSQFH